VQPVGLDRHRHVVGIEPHRHVKLDVRGDLDPEMAVPGGALLLAMGRAFGAVHVENDALAASVGAVALVVMDMLAAGEGAAPRGVLTITAPLVSGTQVLRPIVDAFLDAQPAVRAKLFLLDRPVSLVEEGIDIALRIAHLPDSSLIAIRIGDVRRVVCASPSYLASRPPIVEPGDLSEYSIVAMTTFGQDSWTFAPTTPSGAPRHVAFTARLVVNSVDAAVASAVAGHGLTMAFSYQVPEQVREAKVPHAKDRFRRRARFVDQGLLEEHL
jgi:DNA-binding transcriptional LysR family regulator